LTFIEFKNAPVIPSKMRTKRAVIGRAQGNGIAHAHAHAHAGIEHHFRVIAFGIICLTDNGRQIVGLSVGGYAYTHVAKAYNACVAFYNSLEAAERLRPEYVDRIRMARIV